MKTTIAPDTDHGGGQKGAGDTVLALVIAWCSHEPERIGEIALLPDGSRAVLGRGDGDGEDDGDAARLRFFRWRPSGMTPSPPLASPGISRRQLLLERTAEGLAVTRTGRCALEIDGQRVESAVVAAGGVIAIRRELVLFCVERPARLPPLTYFPREAIGDFGCPDKVGILGESPVIWRLRDRVAFAAKAGTHVLLLGESGTGKELAARAIHRLSPRAAKPFVARNAATLPVGLVDAELFGNARNYPNAGMAERAGLVGSADGGVLFLDEIGELPTELQAHLLRVLDADGEYQRLGDAAQRRSDFRLVAATNRDPGTLKEDLLARVTTRIEIPPLEARREDIPLLVQHLFRLANDKSPEITARFADRRNGALFARVSSGFVAGALRRPFPTNTRELDALLWQAMAESEGDTIDLATAPQPGPAAAATRSPAPAREPTPEEIRSALAAANNNLAAAARALGLSSRYVLYRLLDKHGIRRPGPEGASEG